MKKLKIFPHGGEVKGSIPVPPSKYHLHRALIFGSLAEGETTIVGKSGALHILDTLHSLKDFGIAIRETDDGYRVKGGAYRPANGHIRVGSSGSTLQFMLGLGSLSTGQAAVYNGHKALRERPIKPLLEALGTMGVRWLAEDYKMPVTIQPGKVTGGHVRIQGTLSQWISGLLILAPFAEQDTIVEALPPHNELTYVNLTIGMLREFGIRVEALAGGATWKVAAKQRYKPGRIDIEPDLSSAAFLLALAALFPSDIVLQGLQHAGTHPEGQIIDIIRQYGVDLAIDGQAGGLRARRTGGKAPRQITIDMRHIPDLIPVLSVVAALADGTTTVLQNIGPGRMKESNRVKAMLQLNKMGARIKEVGDDLIIDGVGQLTGGASISTYNDHRVQMAFTLASLRASGNPSELTFPNAYRISYPEFFEHLALLGIDTGLRHGSDERRIAEEALHG
ncbi:3-phosphoshikimate 1-carboxyvinyltransferase [Paenibacillus glycinis]|uniref:3-phosphoshikimate 1-carboxyvinyltransferase n=1 Tax=Paenibacillus glycinis TaxID=2697035 RepID=A0ABW9XKC9_9BACL|nr:3-phosphoshikimate 1-carboxyvinyltransferase [Paenibacillus glycinis]NBD23013.1 3-phosphoshikimate 1-carboxyvinyltransferase [Paenibacillus glycinis]